MKTFKKKDFPVSDMRRFIEPGPIVLVSSHWKGKNNIMTMGWHMCMEFTTIGCYIWSENHSFDMIRKSKECVINVPTYDIIRKVIAIGNSSGDEIDKSTPVPSREDVMRLIMQPIIYQNSIDITPDVLAVLGVNVRNLAPQPTGVPGTAAQPQQGGFQQFK